MSPLASRVVLGLWLGSVLGTPACAQGATPVPESPYTVTVSRDHPATIAAAGLTVQLTQVKDGRCPAGVQCMWAGHAAVTLRVAEAGFPARSVVVGTETPPDMKLPRDAVYRSYTLSLVALEPLPAAEGTVAVSRYVATLRIAKEPGK